MKNLAIIPARGGSSRLRNKNIKEFYGKLILNRTVSIIKKSKIFDEIVLSTDSIRIKNIGLKNNLKIIERNKKLSKNQATTLDVIVDAINKIKNLNFENVCCIYPCNPFLNIKDIKKSFQILEKYNKKFIFPVCEFTHPIERACTLSKGNKKINFINKNNANKNTQFFEKKYHDAGQFYISNPTNWIKKKKMHSDSTCFEINNFNAVDIDDEDDWKMAELIYKYKNK